MGRSSDRCWWSSFEIDSLNSLAQVVAAANEVTKVFAGDFCLHPKFSRLLFFVLQLLNVPLKTNANIVRWTLESASNFRADAQGVLVCVVNGGQLLGQLRAQSVRERLGHRR
jgi:hypothetical protein